MEKGIKEKDIGKWKDKKNHFVLKNQVRAKI